ncbi:ABC transporter permease [Acidothermaceae bacterium B102]|nr:ABC transporter permease [Acidothermaceae bacterium B102]
MAALTMTRPTVDREHAVRWLRSNAVWVAIVLVVVVDAFVINNFFSVSNLRVQLYAVTPTFVVALGMAVVIGTKGIDLSVGAVIALAAAIVPIALSHHLAIILLLLLVLVGGAVSGTVVGSMVAIARVQPIIASLSIMIGLRGLAVIMNGSADKSVTDPFITGFGGGLWLGQPRMAYVAVVLALIVAFLVRRTTFGRSLTAIGDNREAAQLAGLPVRRVLILVYVLCGVLAAIAGVMITGNQGQATPSAAGMSFELFAITAVVVGGTPLEGGEVRIFGTAAGAVLMQLITASLTQEQVQSDYLLIVQGAIVLLAVYATMKRKLR